MKRFFISIAFLFLVFSSNAQVGIGIPNPHSSALLDLTDTTRGLLIPRMTKSQRENIQSPATGLLIFQVDNAKGIYYYSGSSWMNINTSSYSINTPNISYVESNGEDASANINDPAHPFATIDAALDMLPSTGGVIKIGFGAFEAPSYEKIKSNIIFIGSGKPSVSTVITPASYPDVISTIPAKLIGGTILKGSFNIPYNVSNISVRDLGVDVGSEYIAAYKGGVPQEGLVLASYNNPAGGESSADRTHKLQTQMNPRVGIVIKNVTVLNSSSTVATHGLLLENCLNPIVDNINIYFSFAGLVIKTIGGTFTNVHTYACGSYGIIIKSNDYAWCSDINLSNFSCNSIGKFDGGGLTFDTNDPGTPGLRNIVVNNGQFIKTKFGITTQGGGPFNFVALNNIMVDYSLDDGVNTVLLTGANFSNITTKHSGGNGLVVSGTGLVSNVVSSGNANHGVWLIGINFTAIQTSENRGYGLYVPEGAYGTNYRSINDANTVYGNYINTAGLWSNDGNGDVFTANTKGKVTVGSVTPGEQKFNVHGGNAFVQGAVISGDLWSGSGVKLGYGSDGASREAQIRWNPLGPGYNPAGTASNGTTGAKSVSLWTNGLGSSGGSTSGNIILYDGLNLHVLPDGSGQTYFNKDVEITDPTKGYILKSANGIRWRITIDNAGTLKTTRL